ncbi:MAG: hypothetical protein J6Z01_02830, partial [Bacteroidales bacterium]|nr:hypothetical protein [Bacteroidales bacterium]
VPVTGLANKVTGKQIKYTWNADRNHTKYYVEYYDYKRDTIISSSQQDNTVTLTAPEYDYRIKFRVRAECYNDPARVSEYTPWSEAYVQPEKKNRLRVRQAVPRPRDSQPRTQDHLF